MHAGLKWKDRFTVASGSKRVGQCEVVQLTSEQEQQIIARAEQKIFHQNQRALFTKRLKK